ncbi:glutamine synthetase family protein [Pseudonocardia acidicola]|uniref:Glutamine synthetase n=1 Tax=Pseudonocardia acidicola TaxID=2724939 RepID=A0ABX1SB92_9PSEU|nr:glutamine synthetase family protein [Pseudonocardia acidicola]NMH98828.1 glutamine synthetase [Pseudonocardia acidicola]
MATAADPRDLRARAEVQARELAAAGVAGVTVGWADNNGIPRSRTVPIAALPDAATTGIGVTSLFAVFDSADTITYAYEGLATPSGDIRLVAELDGLVRLAGQPALAWAPGRQVDADGEPWPYDQRSVLIRQLARLADAGLSALIGYELEFGVYRDTEDGELIPAHHGPAYSPAALTEIDGFVESVLRDFAANGLHIGQLHAEYGPAQVELSLTATDPLTAADNQLLARQTLRAAAHVHGLRLSFAPLPSTSSAGNGWHLHTSLWRDGSNLLAGGPQGPGPEGAAYIAGLLRDLPAVAAVTAPSLGSLARLRPGYFAGAYRFWGVENREAPLRYVPGSALLGADHANVELKTSDASANPYLALAALLAAGAAGVAEKLPLGPPVQTDPGTWSEADRAERGIAALPKTPSEQEAALTGNLRIAEVLGKELLGAFLAVRRSDAEAAVDRETDDVLAGLRWRY